MSEGIDGVIQIYSPASEYSPGFTFVQPLRDGMYRDDIGEQIDGLLSNGAELQVLAVRPSYEEEVDRYLSEDHHRVELEDAGVTAYVETGSVDYDRRLYDIMDEMDLSRQKVTKESGEVV